MVTDKIKNPSHPICLKDSLHRLTISGKRNRTKKREEFGTDDSILFQQQK